MRYQVSSNAFTHHVYETKVDVHNLVCTIIYIL